MDTPHPVIVAIRDTGDSIRSSSIPHTPLLHGGGPPTLNPKPFKVLVYLHLGLELQIPGLLETLFLSARVQIRNL